MTSPSTLVRKAKAAKNPATAKRLRAQAAKLRRDIRSGTAKKAKKKKAKKVAKKVARSKTPPFTGLIAGIKKSNLDWQVYSDEAGVSRYSEICTSPQPLISDGLMDVIIGYTKSKKPEVQKQARDIIEGQAIGMFQRGKEEQDALHVEALKTVHEINHINVVSAFIAEMEGINKLHGCLPPSLMVSGFTLARVTAALRDAGFTSEGKGGMRRGRPGGLHLDPK